tara:strand:+ start:283 stop:510 length:228 start_codon:yes stop_codon:yes gene_type:complete
VNVDKEKYLPKRGDMIGCADGDFGIVLSTYPSHYSSSKSEVMVEVAWNSGRILTDTWHSQDFTTECAMFWIMSRA